MADSLVLKGVKDIRKHSGSEMQIVNPKRGGNTHQIKEWWRKSVNTTYTGCTLLKVTGTGGTCHLALATGKPEYPEIRIDHDGDFNFTFSGMSEIERAALYTENFELIEHYIFPAIAGGSIVTVTPAGSADRPTGAPPATQVDEVTVSGEVAPTNGDTETYTATTSGTVSGFTYTWGVGAGGTMPSPGSPSVFSTITSAGVMTVTAGGAGTVATGQFVSELTVN